MGNIRTYKRKLILTKAQEARISSWIGVCRLVYNMGLEIKIASYKNNKKGIHKYALMKIVNNMGMFDYLKINVDKLPITQEEKERYAHEFQFQTKDFDCYLNLYEITNDGNIIYRKYTDEYLGETKELFAYTGIPNDNNGEWVILKDYHGFVSFYDSVDNIWFQFEAKFTDGKLQDIKRIK